MVEKNQSRNISSFCSLVSEHSSTQLLVAGVKKSKYHAKEHTIHQTSAMFLSKVILSGMKNLSILLNVGSPSTCSKTKQQQERISACPAALQGNCRGVLFTKTFVLQHCFSCPNPLGCTIWKIIPTYDICHVSPSFPARCWSEEWRRPELARYMWGVFSFSLSFQQLIPNLWRIC